jgi:hypothetical protein
MSPHTFTLKCDGLLDRIITQVGVSHAKTLCEYQGVDILSGDADAIWDTGASGSCVSGKLAHKLGLRVVGQCPIIGVSGTQKTNMYSVDIRLPNEITVSNVLVSEFVDNGTFDVILGMNIITFGDFSISNFNRESLFQFSYPPTAR